MSLASGTRLGPYELLAPLGAGGMGEVYKARDTRLDRTVAIKVLPSHVASNLNLRERFEREARAVAALNHPHICTLHDVGHQDGIDYLVMEYLEGQTLAERLEKGALPLNQALQYAIQIADALDKAHRKGIVHRDLKPGNVMLTKSGVKLLDFGLAKLQPAGAVEGMSVAATMTSPLTGQGTILGTLQYMAPEQLEGREADSRTDIFAFGAMLYEMATGQKAFSGKSQASLISSIMSSDPAPISSIQPMSPPTLDRVIRKCLAKDPEHRWQSAADLGSELEWVSEVGLAPLAATPATRHRLRRERVLLSVALLVAAGSLAVAVLRRPATEAPRRVRLTIPAPGGTVFGSYTEAGAVAVSPDGRRIAFTAMPPRGRSVLWVRDLDTLAARALPGTEGAALPFWSPDGRSLGFFAGGALKRIEVAGGPAQTICDARYSVGGGTWSPEGIIVFSGFSGDQTAPPSAACRGSGRRAGA